MAVHDEIDCNGYSGSAAPFVTQVQVSVDGKVVATHTHAATDDGPWWSFDGALSIVGRQTVTITDRTAGNDYHGEPDNLHRVVELDCPVPTTDAPTTTQVATTQPVATIPVPVLEVDPTVPQSPETTVLLSTVSPSTTTFEGMDGFYVLSETETSTTQPPVLVATGAHVGPLLASGSLFLALGASALLAARPRRGVA